jgi:hypothetical protein
VKTLLSVDYFRFGRDPPADIAGVDNASAI